MNFDITYRQMYADLYVLHKKYANIQDDKQWSSLALELGCFSEKHKGLQYAKDIIALMVDEMERVYFKAKESDK